VSRRAAVKPNSRSASKTAVPPPGAPRGAAAVDLNAALGWLSARPLVTLIAAFALCTLPFVAKPFHLDDPMYLWAAEHIMQKPLDFYGFNVVWGYAGQPMSEIMQNPPLASYLIALAASIFGFNEIALHLVFLLPAAALVIGTHQLARSMCHTPILAALITLFTPVFVVSSLTIMCDMLMVCFWVWAMVLWRGGLRSGKVWLLMIAAFLCGLSALSKYYGICLIPLLAVYTLSQPGKGKLHALWLMIPVLMLLGYELYTAHMYGTGLLAGAAKHASAARIISRARPEAKSIVGLCFLGGTLAPALFLSPWLWSRRSLVLWTAVAAGLYFFADAVLVHQFAIGDVEYKSGPMQFVQVGVWAAVGASILLLTAQDVWRRRNADALLLALWVGGTVVFACFINWSINGRSMLPIAPAAGILLARRLEWRAALSPVLRWRWLAAPLGVSAMLAMAVTWADVTLAASARDAANQLAPAYRRDGHALWFQGHWGFQHYMRGLGAHVMDFSSTRLPPQEYLIVPRNNVNVRPITEPFASVVEIREFPTCRWLSTMNIGTGAGFYSDNWGPLPFAIGGEPEYYQILRMKYGLEPMAPGDIPSDERTGLRR
jgi:4-amino-4-deoxy-L-arabinose transferase-like glycosyltransferase